MRPIVSSVTVKLASSVEDVWPLITDTDRANRITGGNPVVYRAIEEGANTSARFVAETTDSGMKLTYEETPFEWTLHKSFAVFRKMRGGPLLSYTYRVTLEPDKVGGGTLATTHLELVPRNFIFWPIIWFRGFSQKRNVEKLAHAIDEHVRENAPSPFIRPRGAANDEAIEHGARELEKRKIAVSAIEKVVDLLRNGADSDLVRIRPFELAAEWKAERTEILRTFLHGVTLGLFELRWALVCPSCRTANVEVESLDDIGTESHCQLCDLSYGVDLDRAVEATFIAHPQIREVTSQMFCMGGPARTPHVVVQKNVEPGESVTLDIPSEEGRYRFFSRGGAMCTLEVEKAAPNETSITVTSDKELTETSLRVAPGGVVTAKNATSEPRHVKVERLAYANLAATAYEVTLMGEFRRLFSRELLKPSTPLKVAASSILFSDLTGSTALYSTVGDASAFRMVDDHFDILRKEIETRGGTLVKTMGDAVMAAFADPLASVRAARECLRAFEAWRLTLEHGSQIGLKLGVFSGPCYVVTANGAIDYFGQTVNCAARVQHLAVSGELILEKSLFERFSKEERETLVLIEEFQTIVKGVDHPLVLVRTKLAPAT